jgi:hypothetical protein
VRVAHEREVRSTLLDTMCIVDSSAVETIATCYRFRVLRTDDAFVIERRCRWLEPLLHLSLYAVLVPLALATPLTGGLALLPLIGIAVFALRHGLHLGRMGVWSPLCRTLEARAPRAAGAVGRTAVSTVVTLDGVTVRRDEIVAVARTWSPIVTGRLVQVGERWHVDLVLRTRVVRLFDARDKAQANELSERLAEQVGCEKIIERDESTGMTGFAWRFVGRIRGLLLATCLISGNLVLLGVFGSFVMHSLPERRASGVQPLVVLLGAIAFVDVLMMASTALAWRGPTRKAMRDVYGLDEEA